MMSRDQELALLLRVWRAESLIRDDAIGTKAGCADGTERISELESSYSYRLGAILVAAMKSPRACIALPVALFNLGRDWVIARRVSRPVQRGRRSSREETLPSACLDDGAVPVLPSLASLPACIKEVRIAAVCDRFTADNIARECVVTFLTPENWIEEIRSVEPHLLLVESAWSGLEGEWVGKVSPPDDRLLKLIESCKQANIRTVFWNKEDPLHFEAFIDTAKHFDVVFTTDAERIPQYKRELGHNNVHLLAFALQPRMHNPVRRANEARRSAAFFAGAWYGNLQERCADFARLADALALVAPFEIFDRNASSRDAPRIYPDRYKRYIKGEVPYEKTPEVYKHYVAGLTINTIKQSSSMFARRALELMGSGTSVYSNHCHALRLNFGDLIVCTDDGELLLEQAYGELHQPGALAMRWRRLSALRKVLREHTWSRRMEDLVRKCLGHSLRSRSHEVVILTVIRHKNDARLCEMAKRQVGVSCRIHAYVLPGIAVPREVVAVSQDELSWSLHQLFPGKLVAPWHPDDNYGPYYLLDLCLAGEFGFGHVVGKAGFRSLAEGRVTESEGEYRIVDKLEYRRCVFPSDACEHSVGHVIAELDHGGIVGGDFLSIDALSYMEYAAGGELPENSLPAFEEGVNYEALALAAEEIPALEDPGRFPGEATTGAALVQYFSSVSMPPGVSVSSKRHRMEVVSKLPPWEAVRVTSSPLAAMYFDSPSIALDAPGDGAVTVKLEQCSARGRVLRSQTLHAFEAVGVERIEGEAYRRLVLEISGSCVTHIDGVWARPVPPKSPLLLGSGRLLFVVNGYPAKNALYRNAFLHRRVKAYRSRGQAVDVVWVKQDAACATYEFDGVEVTVCSARALKQALASTRYEAIAVHFLDRVSWEAIREASVFVPTTVFLHGVEIQSWWRRGCNYVSGEAKEQARAAGDERSAFWRELFASPVEGLKFVFVSMAFAREVLDDLGVQLKMPWYVIHNPVDTSLFKFESKDDDFRWNILSIRPHASRVYANDIVAAVIRRLSLEPEFASMRFHLVGDGALFDQNFAGLERYGNVRVERTFLAQNEIAVLHRQNGIFLCPTRADTQGVSRDEAMSSGLVPVTCKAGSVAEFVDETCAVLTEVDDVEALAEGVLRLVREPSVFRRMARAAANRVRAQSAVEMVVQQEMDVLGLRDLSTAGNFTESRLINPAGD